MISFCRYGRAVDGPPCCFGGPGVMAGRLPAPVRQSPPGVEGKRAAAGLYGVLRESRSNEHQPHAKYTEGSRRPSVQSKVKANRAAVQGSSGAGFSRVPNAWRSWRRSRRRAKRELSARRQIQGKHGALEVNQVDEVTLALSRVQHFCSTGRPSANLRANI